MEMFVRQIVCALVDQPENVEVRLIADAIAPTCYISVSVHDLGQVIGKQGRIIAAIRLLTRAAAKKQWDQVKVLVEGEGMRERTAN